MWAIITGIIKAVIHAFGVDFLTSGMTRVFGTERWQLFLWIFAHFIISFIFTTILFTIIGSLYVSNLGNFVESLKYLYTTHFIHIKTGDTDFVTVLRMADISFFAVCISPVFAVIMVGLRWRRRRERIKSQLRNYEIEQVDKYILVTDRDLKHLANFFSGIVCIINLRLDNLYIIEKINDKAYKYDKELNLDMPKPILGESFFSAFYWMDLRKEIIAVIKTDQKKTRIFKKFHIIRDDIPIIRHYEIIFILIGNGKCDRMMIYINDITEGSQDGS